MPLDIDLDEPVRGRARADGIDVRHEPIETVDRHLHPIVATVLDRPEVGESGPVSGRRHPDRTWRSDTLEVNVDVSDEVVGDDVAPAGEEVAGHDLVGIHMDGRARLGGDEGEDAGEAADIEDVTRPGRQPGEHLERELVLCPRAAALAPVELLGQDALRRVVHQEAHVVHPALDLTRGHRGRQPRGGIHSEPPADHRLSQRVEQRQGDEPLHRPLQTEPRLPSPAPARVACHRSAPTRTRSR